MATEYGNPKFKDSNKNLSFTMKGQPLDDALGRVVNTVSDENIDISNLEFSSNSDYSKTHNNSVNYDKASLERLYFLSSSAALLTIVVSFINTSYLNKASSICCFSAALNSRLSI